MSTMNGKVPDFTRLASLSKLMDAQFRFPGTKMRFGIDAIIGLIPGVGDFISFLISTYMISIAINKGASGFVLARMILNIIIDVLVGAIPVLGDIFDVVFKANQRNLKLLQEHYQEGRNRGGAWKVVVPVTILFLGLFAGLIWVCYKIVVWIF